MTLWLVGAEYSCMARQSPKVCTNKHPSSVCPSVVVWDRSNQQQAIGSPGAPHSVAEVGGVR